MSSEAERPVQTWLHARVRLMPNLLAQAPPWVRGTFDHSWAPMRALAQQLHYLPPQVWPRLLRWESGHVAICAGDSHYAPGPAIIRHRHVTNVAYVSVEDLALDNERPVHVLGHLLDHHLGCGGDVNGAWLSDGGGISTRWREESQRLAALFALGYGVDAVAQSNARDYFAQSLALYGRDWQRLNIADPQICKWLRSTLWNETFWKMDTNQEEGSEHRNAQR